MVRSCWRIGVASVVLASPGLAQDAVALRGAGGGSIDIDGLQNSLNSGGVEGLSKMLQAMAANGVGPSPHLTKDVSGNAMYDFRDINGPSKSTLPSQAAAALPAAPKAAPMSQQDRNLPPPASSSRSGNELPMPDFGIIEPAATQKLVRKAALPAAPMPRQIPAQSLLKSSSRPEDELPMPDFRIVEQPKTRKPRAATRSLVGAEVATNAPVARPDDDDDDDTDEATTQEHGVQDSHLIVWPPATQAVASPQVNVAKAALPPVVPAAQVQPSTNTNEATVAALANGLESMRRNLDTLVSEADSMAHTHQQVGSLVPTTAPASASIGAAGGAAGAEILKRLQEIEDENAQMKKQEAAQALRLEAVEAKEQKETVELVALEKENVQLRKQVKASKNSAFLQDKTRRDSQMKWGIKTFFHKKHKTSRQ